MFEWLKNEMAKVNTPKFYIVDGPAPADLRKAIEHSDVAIPPSYEEFVFQFGNARLYRQGSVYLVQVFASLIEAESEEGETLLQFGRTDMSLAYFKESLLIRARESPVFEWHHEQGIRQTFDSFEQWLKAKCAAARGQFKKKEWEAIERGPAPFSEQERAIIEARKRFRWQVVGIAPSGDLQFEVYNGSNMILPYLTVGIRHKGGEAFGGVKLPVADIRPGETRIIQIDCYKKTHEPHKVEAFQKPDPEPALRDLYWEFKGLKNGDEC